MLAICGKGGGGGQGSKPGKGQSLALKQSRVVALADTTRDRLSPNNVTQ